MILFVYDILRMYYIIIVLFRIVLSRLLCFWWYTYAEHEAVLKNYASLVFFLCKIKQYITAFCKSSKEGGGGEGPAGIIYTQEITFVMDNGSMLL